MSVWGSDRVSFPSNLVSRPRRVVFLLFCIGESATRNLQLQRWCETILSSRDLVRQTGEQWKNTFQYDRPVFLLLPFQKKQIGHGVKWFQVNEQWGVLITFEQFRQIERKENDEHLERNVCEVHQERMASDTRSHHDETGVTDERNDQEDGESSHSPLMIGSDGGDQGIKANRRRNAKQINPITLNQAN